MSSVFIDQTAAQPHSRTLCFAGAVCDLSTNSPDLTRVLERLSISSDDSEIAGFNMRVIVDESSCEAVGEPHFRGLHHVVTACFGRSNVFVFDILRRTLSGSISAVVAQDDRFWKEKLIPITLGVLGSAMGLVPVHCACMEFDGDGLLIVGESGAGKSTLSVALSKEGFKYVSDDWTYVSRRRDRIVAHGSSAPTKLLPDAVKHFETLHGHDLQTSMNGLSGYEIDIAKTFGVQVRRNCEPRWLIFLDRTGWAGTEFTPMSTAESRRYVNGAVEKLPLQLLEAAGIQEETVTRLVLLPGWRFRYGGTPQFAAKELHKFLVNRQQEVYA